MPSDVEVDVQQVVIDFNIYAARSAVRVSLDRARHVAGASERPAAFDLHVSVSGGGLEGASPPFGF